MESGDEYEYNVDDEVDSDVEVINERSASKDEATIDEEEP